MFASSSSVIPLQGARRNLLSAQSASSYSIHLEFQRSASNSLSAANPLLTRHSAPEATLLGPKRSTSYTAENVSALRALSPPSNPVSFRGAKRVLFVKGAPATLNIVSCSFTRSPASHGAHSHGAAHPTQAPRHTPPPTPAARRRPALAPAMPPHTLAPLAPFWASPRNAVCTCLNRLGDHGDAPSRTQHALPARCPSARCVRRQPPSRIAPLPYPSHEPNSRLCRSPRDASARSAPLVAHRASRAALELVG